MNIFLENIIAKMEKERLILILSIILILLLSCGKKKESLKTAEQLGKELCKCVSDTVLIRRDVAIADSICSFYLRRNNVKYFSCYECRNIDEYKKYVWRRDDFSIYLFDNCEMLRTKHLKKGGTRPFRHNDEYFKSLRW